MAIDMSKVKIEVAIPAAAYLGEGPHWDAELKRLLWVDIYKPSVYIFNPATKENREYNIGDQLKALGLTEKRVAVGAVVPFRGSSTKLLIAAGPYLASFDIESGEVVPIHEIEKDQQTTRLNDGKCDPQGRFWAGTMETKKVEGTQDLEHGSLYMMAPGQEITRKFTNVSVSNGLAWSNDQATFYYIDSNKWVMYAFDYKPENGEISNSRIFINHDKKNGFPDGMAIDTEDHLWVAGFGSGKVFCYDTKNPSVPIASIDIPGAVNITSCCFGGENLDELYVTSATLGKDTSTVPNAGHVFRVTGLGVKGHAGVSYAG